MAQPPDSSAILIIYAFRLNFSRSVANSDLAILSE